MPAPKRLPAYSRHKATNQARVWFNGKDHYLGEYGSEQSRLRYAEILRQAMGGSLEAAKKPVRQPMNPQLSQLTGAVFWQPLS